MINRKKIGLALSGGGFRAASFHLGTLAKLHEMGILEKIDIISTVSGGSIVGAYYCYCKKKGISFSEFYENMYNNLKHNLELRTVINSRTISLLIFITLLSFFVGFSHTWLTGIFTFIFTFVFFVLIRPIPLNFTIIKTHWYDKFFYNKATLKDLPDKPELVINSTNIETGKMWIFTKKRMGDYKYTWGKSKMFDVENFKLSQAVASSSAVPGIFEPIRIAKKFYIKEENAKENRPALSDGGVYDNQGIHKIAYPTSSYKCKYIVCSDAASPLLRQRKFPLNISVLNRTSNIMMTRIRNMQFQEYVVHKEDNHIDEIAYYSYHQDIKYDITELLKNKTYKVKELGLSNEYLKLKEHKINYEDLEDKVFKKLKVSKNFVNDLLNEAEAKRIKKITTRLRITSEEDIKLLVRQGKSLTEYYIRLWCPELVRLINT